MFKESWFCFKYLMSNEYNKAFKLCINLEFMLVKLDNPKLLSDGISIISELVTEAKLRFDANGMSLVAIDPANVALVSFKLPASSFSQFEVGNDILGVSLDSLKSVLRRCGASSSLVIQTFENILKLEIHDKIKRIFSLALIDIEAEEKAVPILDFSGHIEMNCVDFAESIEDCLIVADSCSLIIKDGMFIIEGKGLNSARSEFSSDEVKISGENCKSKFSLEYLNKFSKAAKLSQNVSVSIANDYPLKLEFKNERLEMIFILAPRVETED